MTRRLLSCFAGSVLIFISSAYAEMMPGPAIIGTAPGGPNSVVSIYSDNGDGTYDGLDAHIKSVLADATGAFEVSDLDASLNYFLSNDGQMTGLTEIGDIKRLIDSFDITQTVVSNPTSGSRINHVESNTILGGVRDFYVEVLSGPAEGKLRANPFSRNSNLQIDMTAGTVGMVGVTWDGIAGSTGLAPDAGFNIDFTDDGALNGITLGLAVDRAGEGQELRLAMYSPSGMSVAHLAIPYDPAVDPENNRRFIAFSDFAGDADPTDVTAFQLVIDETMPSLDAQLSVIGLTGPTAVTFIPEPSAGLLIAFGLIGLLGFRRC